MIIYKEAQGISFNNNQFLIGMLGRLRDNEFSVYISTLSQIHSDLQTAGADSLDDVLTWNLDREYDQNNFKKIIQAVGEEVFATNEFDIISQQLSYLRETVTSLEQKPTVPGIEQEPQVVQESVPAEEEGLLARIEKAKAAEYPTKNIIEENKIKRMVRNLDLFYDQIQDDNIPDRVKETVFEALEETLTELSDIASGTGEDVAEEEGEEEETGEGNGVRSEIIMGSEMEASEEDATITRKHEELRRRTDADRESEDAFNHEIYSDSGNFSEYFDLSQDPPVFNLQEYEKVYQKTIAYIDHLHDATAKRINERKGVPPLDMVKEFNDFIFSVKTVEMEIRLKLIEYRDSGRVDDDTFRQINSQITSSLITSRLSYDKDLFETRLLVPITYMANPGIAIKVFGKYGDDESKENISLKISHLAHINQNSLRDKAKDILMGIFYSKFKMLLNPGGVLYESSIRNLIFGTKISKSFLVYLLTKKFAGKPAFESMVHCPTCSKEITWTYSKGMKEALSVTKLRSVRGFRIPIYSIFKRLPEKGKFNVITLDELLYEDIDGEKVERKFLPPTTEDYRGKENEIERTVIGEYKGKKSWRQINEMIYSGNRVSHEEGWHRRSAALKSLGAVPSSNPNAKRASPLYIKGVMSECPYKAAGSSCGLSYSAKQGAQNVFELQPRLTDSFKTWKGENIEEKGLRQDAIKKTAGGYKFSRLTFACPAHITSSRIDETGVESIHYKVAISSAGPAGDNANYISPVDGRTGLPKEMPDGTMSYLICGTTTAISSFDREPNSHGNILYVLSKLRNQNQSGYFKIINYLTSNGVDTNDLLYIDSKIRNMELSVDEFDDELPPETPGETLASEAIRTPNRKKRMKKIAELLTQAAKNVGTDEYELIKNIMLVCPHGHRFTIGHSIDFNETHSGIVVRKYFSSNKDIMNIVGVENIKALIKKGYLVKATDYQARTKSYFENWDKNDLDDLVIPLILESGAEPENYVFNTTKSIRKNIFNASNTGYQQSHNPFVLSELIDESIVSDLIVADLQKGREEGDRDISGLDNMILDSLGDRIRGSSKPGAIPGIALSDKDDDAIENAMKRVAPFGKALKSVIGIVNFWTKGVANSDFAKAVMFAEPGKITKHIDTLIETLVNKKHLFYVVDRNEEQIPAEVISDLKDKISKETNRTVTFYAYFAGMLNRDNAGKILSEGIFNYIMDTYETPAGSNGEIYFAHEFGVEGASGEKTLQFVNSFFDKNEKILKDFLHHGSTNTKTFVHKDYSSRVYQFSTALYLAEMVVDLYNSHLTPRSEEYIGYDIGIDLSSTKKVLEITDTDLEAITMVLPKNYFFGIEERINIVSANIDAAYHMIKMSMIYSSNFSTTPAAMVKSKRMILKNIDKFIPENDREFVNTMFEMSFPDKILNFDKSLEPSKFIPLPVSMGKGDKISKEFLLIEGGLEGTVESEGVIINEKINYRNDRFQVGMIGLKPSKMTWPLELNDGFVGMFVPMPIDDFSKRNGLAFTPIIDYSVLIDSDTAAIDISSLFMRGRNDKQKKEFKRLMHKIKGVVNTYKGKISSASDYDSERELVDELNQKLRELHNQIKAIPPAIRTKRSNLVPELSLETGEQELKEGAGMVAVMTLVEPHVAIEMIEHPYLMFPDFEYEPDTVRLKDFIINVYNLGVVADIIKDVTGEEITAEDLASGNFYERYDSSDYPSEIKRTVNVKLNKIWPKTIGTYYDIIPNETIENKDGELKTGQKNTGSFVTYFYRYLADVLDTKSGEFIVKDVVEKFSLKELDNMLRKAGNLGLIETGQAKRVIKDIPKVLLEYLEAVTAGEFEVESLDTEASYKPSSEILLKIAERKKALQRTILSMGLEGLYID